MTERLSNERLAAIRKDVGFGHGLGLATTIISLTDVERLLDEVRESRAQQTTDRETIARSKRERDEGRSSFSPDFGKDLPS